MIQRCIGSIGNRTFEQDFKCSEVRLTMTITSKCESVAEIESWTEALVRFEEASGARVQGSIFAKDDYIIQRWIITFNF